eukprot:6675981-Pyramimonas_sp.AAC.1
MAAHARERDAPCLDLVRMRAERAVIFMSLPMIAKMAAVEVATSPPSSSAAPASWLPRPSRPSPSAASASLHSSPCTAR